MDSTAFLFGMAACCAAVALLRFVQLGPGPALALAAWGTAAYARANSSSGPLAGPPLAGVFVTAAPLLVAPVLFYAGGALGHTCRRRPGGGAIWRSALLTAGSVFFFGGLALQALDWAGALDAGTSTDSRPLAFLLAAAWAIPAPLSDLLVTSGREPSVPGQPERLWQTLFALATLAWLSSWYAGDALAGGAPRRAAAALALFGTAAIGISAGALLGLTRRWLPDGELPGVLLEAAVVLATTLLARSLSGSPFLAPFLVGLTASLLARPSEPGVHSSGGLWGVLAVLASAALFVGVGGAFPSAIAPGTLPVGAGLWLAFLLVQFLVWLVLSAPSAEAPRWRSALTRAWRQHPQAVAVAGLGAVAVAFPVLPEAIVGAFLQTCLVAALVQGGTAPLLDAWRARASERDWRRWEEREGLRLAYRSCLDELQRLRRHGSLPHAAAETFERTLRAELRALELDALPSSGPAVTLERERWTWALGILLLRAREAVGEAADRGWISHRARIRLQREFLERWRRAADLSASAALTAEATSTGTGTSAGEEVER